MRIYAHYTLTAPLIVCINTHMDSKEVIKALTKAGWIRDRQSGSHVTFKHPDQPLLVTVPHPRRDMPIGLVRSIEKISGLTLR